MKDVKAVFVVIFSILQLSLEHSTKALKQDGELDAREMRDSDEVDTDEPIGESKTNEVFGKPNFPQTADDEESSQFDVSSNHTMHLPKRVIKKYTSYTLNEFKKETMASVDAVFSSAKSSAEGLGGVSESNAIRIGNIANKYAVKIARSVKTDVLSAKRFAIRAIRDVYEVRKSTDVRLQRLAESQHGTTDKLITNIKSNLAQVILKTVKRLRAICGDKNDLVLYGAKQNAKLAKKLFQKINSTISENFQMYHVLGKFSSDQIHDLARMVVRNFQYFANSSKTGEKLFAEISRIENKLADFTNRKIKNVTSYVDRFVGDFPRAKAKMIRRLVRFIAGRGESLNPIKNVSNLQFDLETNGKFFAKKVQSADAKERWLNECLKWNEPTKCYHPTIIEKLTNTVLNELPEGREDQPSPGGERPFKRPNDEPNYYYD